MAVDQSSEKTDFDVLVIGAGISGIGAGYRLSTRCPGKTFAILEARAAIGGTWDLFRYPGIRSDSDMFTLGFPFRPWNREHAIADGASIRDYILETARELGIDRHVRYGHRVERASWSSSAARWTVEVRRADTGERILFTCRFLFMCTGYYDYAGGYTPDFAGIDRYRGRVVHPQKWTDDVDYEGKRVVVIGSGATAVGLVPVVAKKAKHVTMLQRSPTYMMSFPGVDPMARTLGSRVMRARNVAASKAIFLFCRRFPERAKKMLVDGVQKQIQGQLDVATHFTPRYKPWDQRLCLVRDGDLFTAINEGKVDVVTDHIDTFTEKGIRTRSGRELDADLVVTATGLKMLLLGGVPIVVDGKTIEISKTTMYKAAMLSGIPNMAMSLGYVNASWTLRSDLAAEYVCRVLNEMDRQGYSSCVPERAADDPPAEESIFPLASGYVDRGKDVLPRQGAKDPWRNMHGYLGDVMRLRYRAVDDGILRMTR
jgi:monooxygenase